MALEGETTKFHSGLTTPFILVLVSVEGGNPYGVCVKSWLSGAASSLLVRKLRTTAYV